ncbi:MAG: hypothetical protein ACRDLB_15920 [Actinomycetota bacterium]
MTVRRPLALLLCLFLSAGLSAFALSIALADDGYVSDDDDSPGPLDIARFGFFQEEGRDRLTVEIFEDIDPQHLDQQLNWVAIVLDDDVANNGVESVVFVKEQGGALVARLYGPGSVWPEEERYVADLEVVSDGPRALSVFVPPDRFRPYAPYEHWAAQTSFETIGEDDRGYPECNWEAPPPRPFPANGKCYDESSGVTPTFDPSPTTSPHTDPECAFDQSGCRNTYISIFRKDAAFTGRVHHARARCQRHRKVHLKRSVAGTDPIVGTDRTTTNGAWRVPLGATGGRYYAVTKRAERRAGDSWVACKRDRSITVSG